MNGFDSLVRGKRNGGRFVLTAVALVCLALVAFLAVAQVAHLHSNPTDADRCELCIVLHSVAPVAAAAAIIVLVQLGANAAQAEPAFIVCRRQSRLFIRPPPVFC